MKTGLELVEEHRKYKAMLIKANSGDETEQERFNRIAMKSAINSTYGIRSSWAFCEAPSEAVSKLINSECSDYSPTIMDCVNEKDNKCK
jgi:shikimate kinase